ncbi:MAG: DUF5522 domain-containing protein [Actinomycetota bacterium]
MPATRPGWHDTPHPSRFDPGRPDHDPAMAAHRAAIDRGDPGYLDPSTGLFVMTAVHLHHRGWCCDRGCRHCPYVGATTATEGPSR